MTTLHGWICRRAGCGQAKGQIRVWTRTKPPKPGAMIYRAPLCRFCRYPMHATGETKKHYSLAELL
jgi:hypothetical protein